MAVQGYLPSELSPHIKATLRRAGAGQSLVLEAEGNARSASAIDEIVGTLRRHRRHLRAVALTPLLERGAPGRGYHTGGSFPMRAQPSRFESDRWGRPYGFERVHVVDATVFPSIPSGPITSASWPTLTGLRRNALDPESRDGRRVFPRGARDRAADFVGADPRVRPRPTHRVRSLRLQSEHDIRRETARELVVRQQGRANCSANAGIALTSDCSTTAPKYR